MGAVRGAASGALAALLLVGCGDVVGGGQPDLLQAVDGLAVVQCGDTTCEGALCCSLDHGHSGSCQTIALDCRQGSNAVIYVCDDASDCPGQRCCYLGGMTGCAASCDQLTLCARNAECGVGETCCPWGPAPSLRRCAKACP